MPDARTEAGTSTSAVASVRHDPKADSGKAGPTARGRRGRRKQTTVVWFLVAAAGSAMLAWVLSTSSPMQLLELKGYDVRWILLGNQPPPSNVILVMLDERTEAMIQEPRIFWHPHFASVLRAAADGGAQAIGLDVGFGLSVEPWAPDLDRQLASAYAEVSVSVPVVLAYDNLTPLPEGLPLYILASIQGRMGYANLTVDSDNFVRRQQLRSGDADAYESFAARLASAALNAEWTAESSQGEPPEGELRLGGRTVPLDGSGFMLIHFWGPQGTFRSVSMADVIEAAQQGNTGQLEEWFRENIVLIGTQDPADQKSTPFYLAGGGQQLTSGVEIHASIVATLLEGRFLRDVSPTRAIALVVLFAFLATGLAFRFRFPVAPVLLAGIFGIYFAISVKVEGNGLVLPLVAPGLGIVLGGFSGYGVYSLTEGRNRRRIQDMFGRFVSPELAQEILAREELPLGGTRQPVTVMFCDLRDFTTYCQGRDPHQVVEELNIYFTDMTAEIKAHGGMVNKFIGDGIMALFGAPVPHAEDAYRAVVCAQRMVDRNREFNRQRKADGKDPLVLGVGIHTGEAVVGTIGTPDKMEYTAIGDTVNVAARIEGENKTFRTQVLLSEATYRLIQGRVEAERMGDAKLKGVTELVTVFSVARVE